MTSFVLESRADITLRAYEEVAWRQRPVELHPAALQRMQAAREAFLELLERDPEVVIYGVTSGYGSRARFRFTAEERLAHAGVRSHATATAFGAALPGRVVRGIVLARLTNFIEGHSAVSPEVALAVAAMLDGRALPEVPAEGVGCPGEIQPLGHLFAPVVDTAPLAAKDLLCLVNGSPCASALVADAVLAGRRRLELATAVFGLALEALQAPLEAYDPVLEALWEDEHEAAALRRLRAWSAGGAAQRRPYQAPVSFRIVPRVLGQAARALAQAGEVAEVSLRAVSDNPVFVLPDAAHPLGRVLSNGGYHNAKAYPALDQLGASYADLALLADRELTKLLDGNVSGLPNQLIENDGRALDGSFLGCLGMTALAYAEQARHAATRTLLPGSEGGGFGQNDVAVPTFPAFRKQAEAGRCLEAALACLAVVASQAFFITGRAAPPALAAFLARVRAAAPPVTAPIALGPDLLMLQQAFEDAVLQVDRPAWLALSTG